MNVMASGGFGWHCDRCWFNYATVRSIIDDLSRVSAMAVQSGDKLHCGRRFKSSIRRGKLKLSDIRANADIKDGG